MKKNKDKSLEYRRQLRKNQTITEEIIWSHLRSKNLGYKCRRQHPVGPYIVDFYFPSARLVVEIDGIQHEGQKEYDARRDSYLRARGLEILRFSNGDVHDALDEVLDEIFMKVDTKTPSSSLFFL